MRANKENIVVFSRKPGDRRIYSDLAKLDAHVIQPEEYEDAPELTDEQIRNAVLHINGVPVKRGRPKAAVTKQAVNLRLSRDVLEHFKAGGAGWQTRIDQALRKAARLK
jgi:uncharacterized protein (DUF4415 family)